MRIAAPAKLGLVLSFFGLSPAVAEPPVTTFELENGMQAVVIEDHRVPVVTHMVWYPVGSADEPWGTSGIAHFLEHLMFKGTDEIPEGTFSKIIAENGGQDNAFTSYDYTGYFQRIASDRLELVMRMEADRMRDLVLSEEAVRTERDVILEERSQRTDNNPQSLFSEQLRAALYQNHPYGVPIIGWRHEMETLSREDAFAFYERFYAPDNAFLVVAGAVDPAEVERLAKIHYGPLQPSGNPPDARPQEPPQLAERRLEMRDARVRQPYVLRQYLVPSYDGDNPVESAALNLFADVLGSGITSRLGQVLEVEQANAVASGAWYSPSSRDATELGIYAVPAQGVALDEIEAAMDAVLAELVETGPSEEELERAKSKQLASYIFAQDNQSSLARLYGQALAVGHTVQDVQRWPDVVRSVTVADVKSAALKWLDRERSVTGWLMGTQEAG
ncbi:MAG: pitrilysin family protein [Pseudomonadota bacterium]